MGYEPRGFYDPQFGSGTTRPCFFEFRYHILTKHANPSHEIYQEIAMLG